MEKTLLLGKIDGNTGADKVDIDWRIDTRDKGDHMNYTGACKVTDWLGDYLNRTKLVESRRNDERCKEWDNALDRFNSKAT